ncbi:MAG: hypothetical protein NVS9B2_23490 [Steroidobacteraceae bacterium]
MPGILPLVRGGVSATLYPFVKRITFDTAIIMNSNATEQRWRRRMPLYEFEWTYNTLSKLDQTAIVAFFNARRGLYDTTWSYTLGTTTFNDLTFLTDAIEGLQGSTATYNLRITARQVRNPGWAAPAVTNDWPTFSTGANLQIPYGYQYRNLTTAGDSPTGMRYVWQWWGGQIPGFPTGALRRFPITFSLPDADALTMETFFLAMQGRLKTFNYTDPVQALSYFKMRFDSDVLELRYEDINRVRVATTLIEIN